MKEINHIGKFFRKTTVIGLVAITFIFFPKVYAMKPLKSIGITKPIRPIFSTSMKVEEFRKHYWYKDELLKICKKHKIAELGTKATLKAKIENFLTGENDFLGSKKENLKISMTDKEIGLISNLNSEYYIELSTEVIDVFSFSANWRIFCGRVLGEPNFKFTKEMAAAVREVKRKKDHSFTVRDLLAIYRTGKTRKATGESLPSYMQLEEQTYQWNNFVRDFNADPRSKAFSNKMKVAAILWSKVRDNPGLKFYYTDLIDVHAEEITGFQ